MEIVLEDDPRETPAGFHPLPLGEAIAKARRDRPELSAAGRRVGVDELNARVARDQMTPRLDLSLQAGSSGLGGNQLPVVLPVGGTTSLVTGGLGDSLYQLFGFSSPYYGFSLTLGIPVRSSAAQASLTDALVNRVRDRYSQRQIEQQVILDVETGQPAARSGPGIGGSGQDIARSVAAKRGCGADEVPARHGDRLRTPDGTEPTGHRGSFAGERLRGLSEGGSGLPARHWTTLDDLGFVLESPRVR